MSLARNSLSVFGTQIVLRAVTMVLSILLARTLGPAGKGAFSLIWLVPFMLALFGGLGIGTANVYLLGKRKYSIDAIANSSILLALISGGALIGIFLILRKHIFVYFLKGLEPNLVMIALAATPILIFTDYFRNILLAKERILQFNILGGIDQILLLTVVGWLVLVANINLNTIIMLQLGSVILAAALALIFTRKLFLFRPKLDFHLLDSSIRYGSKVYLANLMQFFNYRLDLFIVNFFIGLANTGQYSIAVSLAGLLWFLPHSVGTALFPNISSSTTAEADKKTPVVCRNTIFITLIGALVLLALGKALIVGLYGTGFTAAVMPFWLLLPGTVAFSIPKVINSDLIGRGRPEISTYCAFVSLIATIALDLLLIPRWGINGAAVASTIAYTIYAAIMLVSFLMISKNSAFKTLIVQPADFLIYKESLVNAQTEIKNALKTKLRIRLEDEVGTG